MVKKSGLGRGLSALIPVNKDNEEFEGKYRELAIAEIQPNPDQPRQYFEEDQLQELAISIKNHGVIQPIIVTPYKKGYMVIAGERRWRASQIAGYDKIPAVIRDVEQGQMLALALLENIQRQELNAIEEALAYRKLLDEHQFTHETLASHLGKSRVTISNTIRLLKLPERIQNMIQDATLSFGHARCLITLEDPEKVEKLARTCIEKQWSVRELERRVSLEKAEKKASAKPKKNKWVKDGEKRLTQWFGNKVTIGGDGKKGKIMISYASEKELQSILDKFQQ